MNILSINSCLKKIEFVLKHTDDVKKHDLIERVDSKVTVELIRVQ